MPETPPKVLVLRLTYYSNLHTYLDRMGLHARAHVPDDGRPYRSIHSQDVHDARGRYRVPRGPGGTIHDYVPFYFGSHSPMLLRLKTGYVNGYDEGQSPLVYIVGSAHAIHERGKKYVFTDGHGYARWTRWFDHIRHLDEVD